MATRLNRRSPWIVLLAAFVAGAALAQTVPSVKKPGGSVPARGALPKGSALPDTILARVGKSRWVGLSEFQRAWRQVTPPARPDSLTPQAAREFLDLLIGKEILAENALTQNFQWTAEESSLYQQQRDQLTLRAALESALKEAGLIGAPGDTSRDEQALGIAVRESAATRMDIRFDEPLVGRLTAAWKALPRPSRDSSLTSQLRAMGAMPVVSEQDTGGVIAESGEGPYRVRDLIHSWRYTNPVQRLRVESPDQLRDLVKNGLFERALRRQARERNLEKLPAVAAALAERREYFAVSHLVEREVYLKLESDSLTMRKWYEQHVDEYDLPDRTVVFRMTLPDRAAAGRMAARLLSAVEAETLVATGLRSRVRYLNEITAESDKELFAMAWKAGPGTVLGPDSIATGFRVARVQELRPSRRRTFEEAVELVRHHYSGTEGERMMQELIARMRKRTPVTINTRAVERLAGS